MTKTIFLATIVAVTILGLAASPLAINHIAVADHGEPIIQKCIRGTIYDPNSGTCIPEVDCPNGVSADAPPHCSTLTKAQQKAVDKAQKTVDKACEKITKEIAKLIKKGEKVPQALLDLKEQVCEPREIPCPREICRVKEL